MKLLLLILAFQAFLVVVLGEAVEARDPVCSEPIEEGICRALIRRYGYDQQKDRCVKFYYGGCEGNENRFKTRKECRLKCKPKGKGKKTT